MSNKTADQIGAECAIAYGTSNDDCNKFVKAVGAVFFDPDIFSECSGHPVRS